MAEINVFLEGYYDIAAHAGTMSKMSEGIKSNLLSLKNHQSISPIVNACEIESDVSSAEALLDEITFRTNRLYEIAAYTYTVYSEVENREKKLVESTVSIPENEMEIVYNTDEVVIGDPEVSVFGDVGAGTSTVVGDGKSPILEGADVAVSILGGISAGIGAVDFILDKAIAPILKAIAIKGITFTTKGMYTIVSGFTRSTGMGTRYLTETITKGWKDLPIFKNYKAVTEWSKKLEKIGDWVGLVADIGSAAVDIFDIWQDDEMSTRDKVIGTIGETISGGLAAAMNFVPGVGTVAGIVFGSDAFGTAATAYVEDIVVTGEQTVDAAVDAYKDGYTDVSKITDSFKESVGDAWKTGGEIISTAWKEFDEAEGLLGKGLGLIEVAASGFSAAFEVQMGVMAATSAAALSTVAATGAVVAADAVEACKDVADTVADAYNTGTVDLAKIGENFADQVGDAVESGKQTVQSAIDSFNDAEGLEKALGAVEVGVAAVSAGVQVVASTAVSAVSTVVSTAASAVAAAPKAIETIAKAAGDVVVEAATTVANAVSSAASAVGNAVSSAAKSVKNFFKKW